MKPIEKIFEASKVDNHHHIHQIVEYPGRGVSLQEEVLIVSQAPFCLTKARELQLQKHRLTVSESAARAHCLAVAGKVLFCADRDNARTSLIVYTQRQTCGRVLIWRVS